MKIEILAVFSSVFRAAFADQACEQSSLVQVNQVAKTSTRTARTSRILGGWCQASYYDTCVWGSAATILAPGSFQSDASIQPREENWAGQEYPDGVWYTVGGEGVGSVDPSVCLDIPTIVANAEAVSATGLAFDMEGCLDGKTNELVSALVAAGNTMPTMYVPKGDETEVPQYDELKDAFNVIAPMLYWGSSSYQDGITCEIIMG